MRRYKITEYSVICKTVVGCNQIHCAFIWWWSHQKQ